MLDMFTIIWGSEMTETYLRMVLPSILQEGNIPAAKELLHEYSFYASKEAKEAIIQSELYTQLSREIGINWFPLQKGEWETTSNFLHQMRMDVEEGHYMLIVPPDTAVGNRSILNMARLCDGQHNPILYGFPRVSEEGFQILRSLFRERKLVSNRELVSIAMRHIEQMTYFIAEDKAEHWVVRHHAPTSCVLPDDKIFRICATNTKKYGDFDQSLPYITVRNGYPWYLIRHSDEFFCVERGKHFVHQIAPVWDLQNQLLGLAFFGKEDAVWQGES